MLFAANVVEGPAVVFQRTLDSQHQLNESGFTSRGKTRVGESCNKGTASAGPTMALNRRGFTGRGKTLLLEPDSRKTLKQGLKPHRIFGLIGTTEDVP